MSSEAIRQRLFFALWPNDELRDYFHQAQQILKKSGLHGRVLVPDNIHLTLVYIGGVSLEQRTAIEEMAGNIRLPSFSFDIETSGYWRRPRVAWAGCATLEPALLKLVYALRQGQESLGLPSESRPYAPHITLMRKVNPPKKALPALPAKTWSVRDFCLVQSISEKSGVRYQVERKWMLQ